jgi:hypothetical protein
MRIPVLFKELQYVGRAEGDKSTYHVFKGESTVKARQPPHFPFCSSVGNSFQTGSSMWGEPL